MTVFVTGGVGFIGSKFFFDWLRQHWSRAVGNVGAESHVDRRIHGPEDFIPTNVMGAFGLFEIVRQYWSVLNAAERGAFRSLRVSAVACAASWMKAAASRSNAYRSICTPDCEVHRLANPCCIPLETTLVLSSSCLGKEGIVRFENGYDRIQS